MEQTKKKCIHYMFSVQRNVRINDREREKRMCCDSNEDKVQMQIWLRLRKNIGETIGINSRQREEWTTDSMSSKYVWASRCDKEDWYPDCRLKREKRMSSIGTKEWRKTYVLRDGRPHLANRRKMRQSDRPKELNLPNRNSFSGDEYFPSPPRDQAWTRSL